MHPIARIRFEGGMLMLPSRTPYEVEILLENLDWYAASHRTVQLEIDRHRWRVEHGSGPRDDACAWCRRGASLTFIDGARVSLCTSCARSAVSKRFAGWPRADGESRRPAADHGPRRALAAE